MKEAFIGLLTIVALMVILVPTYHIGKLHGTQEIYRKVANTCTEEGKTLTFGSEFIDLEYRCKIVHKEKK